MKGNITLESRRRLEQILNTLLDIPGPETIRTVRAIMVLERIGSPEAKTVLESLARRARRSRDRGSQGVVGAAQWANNRVALTCRCHNSAEYHKAHKRDACAAPVAHWLVTLASFLLFVQPLRGRASKVTQLTLYTISSQALRIFCEGDTDVCSWLLAVH